MPRTARIVIAGVPHHVTQRGNNRQNVFQRDADREAYIETLGEQCRRHNVSVLAYCLMRNHVHLLLMPRTVSGLAQAVGRTNWNYTQRFNRAHKRSGHLWHNRFFSCPLGHDHFWSAFRYIELNPTRAGINSVAEEYRWSSAAAHCRGKDELNLLDMKTWEKWCTESGWSINNWRQILAEPEQEVEIASIRRATRTGRPLAEGKALRSMEKRVGRPLAARLPGRPKGSTKKNKK